MKKYWKLFKDFITFGIGSLGSKIILFFLVPLYTNYLTTSDFGISELVSTCVQLAVPIVSLVVYDGVLRFCLSKSVKKEDVLVSSFIVVLIGSAILIVSLPVFESVSSFGQWKYYFFFYSVMCMINYIFLNYIKGIGKNKLYAVSNILQTCFLAALNIVLLIVLKAGIKGYLLANILSLIVGVLVMGIFGSVFKDLFRGSFDSVLTKKMLLFSAPLVLNNISWWAIHSSDKLMLDAMIDTSAVGIYSVAAKIPSLINVFITIFAQAWNISAVNEFENSSKDSAYFKNIFFINYSLIVLICSLAIVFKNPFIVFFVGNDFAAAGIYIPFLLVASVFNCISSFFGSIYSASKKTINNMLTTIIAAIVNVGINFILIRKIGVIGAAFGTLVAYFVLSAIRLFDARRYIHFRINFVLLLSNLIILVGQSSLVTFFEIPMWASFLFFAALLCLNGACYILIVRRVKKWKRSI